MNPLPSKAHRPRHTVLLSLCGLVPEELDQLPFLSPREWQLLLRWLDTSGLALSFLDRLTELELLYLLPPPVLARLQRNLADNRERTAALLADAAILHRNFQAAGLSYATLKGFSLWPISVPRFELRSQLDLDFLISETHAPEAMRILEALNYRRHGISGRSWEFRTNVEGVPTMADLYKPMRHRAVELHLESATGAESRLLRAEERQFHGTRMPVLSPLDLFLDQGLHLFKHTNGAFARTAHFVEFRRHIRARHHDDRFWKSLRHLAHRDPKPPIALGLVIHLLSTVTGDFAPELLTSWTVDRLPPAARLWADRYKFEKLFGNPPGTKLHLLLQQPLQLAGVPPKRSLRKSLIPSRLPPAIGYRPPDESLPNRIERYRRQLGSFLLQLRFHLVEGFRFLWESARASESFVRAKGPAYTSLEQSPRFGSANRTKR